MKQPHTLDSVGFGAENSDQIGSSRAAAKASNTKPPVRGRKVRTFGLRPGQRLGPNYRVVRLLGRGTEGEVYQLYETAIGFYRTAKLYFPHKNRAGRATRVQAERLRRLLHCPMVLRFYGTLQFTHGAVEASGLISEFCPGTLLEKWIAQHDGGRLTEDEALHLLYQLTCGLEAVHQSGEYHADVHSQNVLVVSRPDGYALKLFDFFDWGRPAQYKQHQDIVDTVRIFYESLGGRPAYKQQSDTVRFICGAMQRRHILKHFPTMTALRQHLEPLVLARAA